MWGAEPLDPALGNDVEATPQVKATGVEWGGAGSEHRRWGPAPGITIRGTEKMGASEHARGPAGALRTWPWEEGVRGASPG